MHGPFEVLTRALENLEASPKTLVLLDEDFETQEAMRYVLEGEGYSVLVAGTGLEALGLIDSLHVPFLVILSLTVPVVDGYELLEAIQARTDLPDFPIVLMSGHTKTELRFGGRSVVAALQKPVKLGALLHTLDEFCPVEEPCPAFA